MKLTKANEQKLFITKARLWANVYHAVTASLNKTTSSQYDFDNAAPCEADRAVKFFDDRFTQKPEPKSAEEPPLELIQLLGRLYDIFSDLETLESNGGKFSESAEFLGLKEKFDALEKTHQFTKVIHWIKHGKI